MMQYTPSITKVQAEDEYKIRFFLKNGEERVVDFADELWGEVFEPLKNKELFRQVQFFPEIGTIAWPTGADIAPEFLEKMLTRSMLSEKHLAEVKSEKGVQTYTSKEDFFQSLHAL